PSTEAADIRSTRTPADPTTGTAPVAAAVAVAAATAGGATGVAPAAPSEDGAVAGGPAWSYGSNSASTTWATIASRAPPRCHRPAGRTACPSNLGTPLSGPQAS